MPRTTRSISRASRPARSRTKSPTRPARDIKEPEPPFPKQRQQPPGLEERMRPKPRFDAPEYRAAGKLEGLAALVTGGDSGIGRAVAVMFAKEGCDVAIVFLPSEQLDAETTRRAVQAEGQRCLLLPADVSRPEGCEEVVRRTMDEFGRLDVLVNNAATQQSQHRLEDIPDDQWDRTFRTNIYGYFYMTRAVLPHLKRGASIINTGSITGLEGSSELLDYSATKGAIHAFTKSLAQNLVPRGIRVNCVAPGRAGQPHEIAPAFVFFASAADSSYITGEVLTLLGGSTTAS